MSLTTDESRDAQPAHEERTSTLTGGEGPLGAPLRVSRTQRRRGMWWRRLVLLGLATFLVLGALDVFGLHVDHTSAESNGYQLEVTYPRTGRSGIGAPIAIEVKKDGGFGDKPVKISMSSKYFDILAQYSFDPDPSSATQSDKAITWEFDPPPGDTLNVSISTEFSPDEHPGTHTAHVTVLDDNDQPAVHTQFTTWEWP